MNIGKTNHRQDENKQQKEDDKGSGTGDQPYKKAFFGLANLNILTVKFLNSG